MSRWFDGLVEEEEGADEGQQIAQRSTRLLWPPLNFDICSHDIHSTMPSLREATATLGVSRAVEGRRGMAVAVMFLMTVELVVVVLSEERPWHARLSVASPAVGVSSAVPA